MPDNSATELLTLAEAMRRLEADEVAREMAKFREETTGCPSSPELNEFAARGWREEWNRESHAAWCLYCRAAARVGFRYGRPESWVLGEPSNPDRPRWWREAAQDYLETEAPFWLKAAARLFAGWRAKPRVSGQSAPEPARGLEGALLQRIKVANFFDVDTDLDTTLYEESNEAGPVSYVLKVDDADSSRQPRTVTAGLGTPVGHLLREVHMDWKGNLLVGDVRIERHEIQAIGGPEGLYPIPGVETSGTAQEHEDLELHD